MEFLMKQRDDRIIGQINRMQRDSSNVMNGAATIVNENAMIPLGPIGRINANLNSQTVESQTNSVLQAVTEPVDIPEGARRA